jgi:hypothetical protein
MLVSGCFFYGAGQENVSVPSAAVGGDNSSIASDTRRVHRSGKAGVCLYHVNPPEIWESGHLLGAIYLHEPGGFSAALAPPQKSDTDLLLRQSAVHN